jgi:predicted anti-sigma-YlaC factor YlaD
MRCEEIRELLITDYADGELDKGRLESIRLHIEGCPQCRSLESRIMSIRTSLKAERQEVPAAYIWERLKLKIASGEVYRVGFLEKAGESFNAFFLSPRFKLARTAVVTAAIIIITLGVVLFSRVESPNGTDFYAPYSYDAAADDGHGFGTGIEQYFL